MMDDYTKTPCVYVIISVEVLMKLTRFPHMRILSDVRFSRLHSRQPKMMDDYIKTPCVYDIIISKIL